MIKIKSYKVGILKTNCYLLEEQLSKKGVIVDPGGKSLLLEDDIKGLKIEYILLTHGHFDHIAKAAMYRRLTGAKIIIGEQEQEFTKNDSLNLCHDFYKKGIEHFEVDKCVKGGDSLYLGNCKIKVIDTPGHTRAGVCYVVDNMIFSGDTLFKGAVGRTDLETGSKSNLKSSIEKLYSLEEDYKVYPGHGDFTTLYAEKDKKTRI